jgi:hypothetical protein
MDELELTEIECDAVLLDDDAWNAKYALPETAPEPAPEEPADPYEWMHTCLARLLPKSMQSNEKIWNGTISALKAADVRSEKQLDAMSSDDFKMANVPLIARHHLVKNRKGGEGAEDPPSGRSPQSGLNTPASDDGRHDGAATTHSQNPSEKSSTSLSAPSTASTPSDSAAPQSARSSAQDGAPLLYDASVGAGIKEESIGEDGEGEEVTLTINVARQRIKLKARSVWDLEEHKFGKSTLCRAFTW